MGKSTLELKGFDEFYEKLQRMSDNADSIASQKFNECLDILDQELKSNAQKAGVPSHLTNKITKQRWGDGSDGVWIGEVGWKQSRQKNPLSDYYKVIFLNYGTPSRKTRKGGQRIQINGKWVTLGEDRGSIVKRGFIKRAKASAKRRTKALMKEALAEIMNGD